MRLNYTQSAQLPVSTLAAIAMISVSTLAQTIEAPVLFRVVLPRPVLCSAVGN
jgi:hypothetical protein